MPRSQQISMSSMFTTKGQYWKRKQLAIGNGYLPFNLQQKKHLAIWPLNDQSSNLPVWNLFVTSEQSAGILSKREIGRQSITFAWLNIGQDTGKVALSKISFSKTNLGVCYSVGWLFSYCWYNLHSPEKFARHYRISGWHKILINIGL